MLLHLLVVEEWLCELFHARDWLKTYGQGPCGTLTIALSPCGNFELIETLFLILLRQYLVFFYYNSKVRIISWKFPVNISIIGWWVLISQLEVCQEGGSRRGVLGGRWGLLTGDMEDMVVPDVMNDVFYPKEDTLKISCWYLNQKCVRKGGSRKGVLGWHWGFLTRDMDDQVILDVMNDVLLS